MQRILSRLGLAAVLACAGYGGFRWYRVAMAGSGEASAVLQIPRELMTRMHLFERAKGIGESDFLLADEVLDGTLARLKDREVALQPTSQDESTRACLLGRCRAQIESEADQERVTVTYRGPSSVEALSALTAVVDTLREIQIPEKLMGKGNRSDGRPSQLTILAERESNVAERIKELEIAISHQGEALETQGLSEAERVVLPEQIKRLALDLTEARRDRLEAEHRLIQTRKDLAAGLPVDVLVSRLPGNEARDVLQKVLARPQLAEELRTGQAEYDRLAQVYGPRHPRMLEIRDKIDALQVRATRADSAISGNAMVRSSTAAELLQRLMGAELEERQALENDLQEQFDARKGALDQQEVWMATAARLQKELQALQEERDSLRRKIVEARRQWQEHVTEVLVPPGLVEATIDSRLPFRAIVGFIGGLALAVGLYLRRFRRRAESREYQVERVNTLSNMPVVASMNPVPRMAPAPQRSPSPPPSPLAALLAARKPSPAESTSLDPLRDKADRAARLARLKSLTQSPTLAPHSV